MPDAITTAPISERAPAATPAAPARKPRICPNCSGEFFRPIKGPGQGKRFCSDKCRGDWGNREKAEGAVSATLLKIWAANRNNETGNRAFARLREIADVLNQNDMAAGRHKLKADGPLAHYIEAVVAEPYIDRRRPASASRSTRRR